MPWSTPVSSSMAIKSGLGAAGLLPDEDHARHVDVQSVPDVGDVLAWSYAAAVSSSRREDIGWVCSGN